MKKAINIIDFGSILGTDTMPVLYPKFMTSLEIIKEVMNVPDDAVKCLARKAGIDDSNMKSECVDMDSLYEFSDAYVLKLKSYFNRMKRHSDQVGMEDQLAFENFCKQFKKPECTLAKADTWNDINEDAIREEFFAQIKEKSSNQLSPFLQFEDVDTLPLIGKLEDFSNYYGNFRSSSILLYSTTDRQSVEKRRILQKVIQCKLYHGRIKIKRQQFTPVNNVRNQQRSAHYYIYSKSDSKDHHEEGVSIYEGIANKIFHVAA